MAQKTKTATVEAVAQQGNGADAKVANMARVEAGAELVRLERELGFPVWDNRGGSFPEVANSERMRRARQCWKRAGSPNS